MLMGLTVKLSPILFKKTKTKHIYKTELISAEKKNWVFYILRLQRFTCTPLRSRTDDPIASPGMYISGRFILALSRPHAPNWQHCGASCKKKKGIIIRHLNHGTLFALLNCRKLQQRPQNNPKPSLLILFSQSPLVCPKVNPLFPEWDMEICHQFSFAARAGPFLSPVTVCLLLFTHTVNHLRTFRKQGSLQRGFRPNC